MRLVFMGTPEFAVTALDALVAAGHTIVAVYTQPPRPANRGRLTPSPVHARADALGLAMRTPDRLRSGEEQDAFVAVGADAAVVAAYGLILPKAVLAGTRLGCFNIHASLLPRWRGAAPVQRAIMAGDTQTGVTIMRMEAGLDTGPMLLAEACPVHGHTAGTLTALLAGMGARLMVEALARLDTLAETPQPTEGISYAAKIDKAEARIDWSRDAVDLERLVRAMQPAPGAWFEADGVRVKLIAASLADGAGQGGAMLDGGRVACGSGALRLRMVQPAGRPAMAAEDWLRGARLARGRLD